MESKNLDLCCCSKYINRIMTRKSLITGIYVSVKLTIVFFLCNLKVATNTPVKCCFDLTCLTLQLSGFPVETNRHCLAWFFFNQYECGTTQIIQSNSIKEKLIYWYRQLEKRGFIWELSKYSSPVKWDPMEWIVYFVTFLDADILFSWF